MKSKNRWSWLFGGEPAKPTKKKRRPVRHRMSDGHSLNEREDECYSNDTTTSRRSAAEKTKENERVAPRSRRDETLHVRRTPQRLRLESPHDFYITNDAASESMILRACRMRGFSEFLPAATGEGLGSVAKWLILEHPDGKLSYVLSDRIWYIEETSETMIRSGSDLTSNELDQSKSGQSNV